MSDTPCLDVCSNAVQQVEFFSSPADTCKSGSKFLQAYAPCAQCAMDVKAWQTTQYMPDSLNPVLSYCRMEFNYLTENSVVTWTTSNQIIISTIVLYSISELPTEPTGPITGIPPTTVVTSQISTPLNTASSENQLPSQTSTIPQVTENPQTKVGNSNSTLTWVIGPALGFAALLALCLLLWLYIKSRKQENPENYDSDGVKKHPPSKTRLPLKSALKPIRRSPSSLRRLFHIYELPGSALPHELPGSTYHPQELQGSSPRPKSTRNLHGKGPGDVQVLEAAYITAKSLAADHIKEMSEIAPREKRKPKR